MQINVPKWKSLPIFRTLSGVLPAAFVLKARLIRSWEAARPADRMLPFVWLMECLSPLPWRLCLSDCSALDAFDRNTFPVSESGKEIRLDLMSELCFGAAFFGDLARAYSEGMPERLALPLADYPCADLRM